MGLLSCEEFIMATAKEEIEELLGKVPNDCSLEDLSISPLCPRKGSNGIEAAETEGNLPHEEAEGG
jgi:hypothetical protein